MWHPGPPNPRSASGYGYCLSLWNPTTRVFRCLPPWPFLTEHLVCNYDHVFELGFDPLTHDYKVVWILLLFDNWGKGLGQGYYLRIFVCVYSSCVNSWKNLQFPSSFTSGSPYSITYLNGVYYCSCRSLDNNICKIKTFAMGIEHFGEMQGPYILGKHWGGL